MYPQTMSVKKISSDWTTDPESKAHSAVRQLAREQALLFLGLSRKYSGKVRERLLRDGIPAQTAEDVIAELTAEGRLDDRTVAEAWLKQRKPEQAESDERLMYRLQAAGCSGAAAQQAIGQLEPERNRLRRFIYIMQTRQNCGTSACARKAAARGFTFEAIEEALGDG